MFWREGMLYLEGTPYRDHPMGNISQAGRPLDIGSDGWFVYQKLLGLGWKITPES